MSVSKIYWVPHPEMDIGFFIYLFKAVLQVPEEFPHRPFSLSGVNNV